MRITVGLATCGISAGGIPVFETLKKELDCKVEKVGCIGMCHNEPIVTVSDDKTYIYGNVTKDNVDKIIRAVKDKKPCAELLIANDINELEFYKKQKRLVTENCGVINPLDLDQYKDAGGYSGLQNAVKLQPEQVIQNITDSGLRGRGGAGFPTGMKWKFISGKKGKKYLICNGDEGDPGAFMNRLVMESDPFKMIEGMTIGAYATGADEGIIYTRAEYPLAIQTLEIAIQTAYKENLLGKDILGKGFNFDLRIQKGAGAFVCGEETALINSIEGKRGSPRPRPPYPAEKGLYGKPTVVNNVGTWAHVATIMKMGAKEYAKIGTAKTKGTKVICLTGHIKRTGVIEVPIGTKLKEIIFDIGGGCPDGTKFKALLSGGPAGGCIPEDKLDTPLDFEPLQELGAIMGSGGLVVINDKSCMVDVAKYFMNFTQEESCGKCTPCREGTKRLLEMLQSITRGAGKPGDIEKIEKLSNFVRDNSLCGLGQNAPNPILSTLRYFRQEYDAHITDKACPAKACLDLVSYHITEHCKGCGNCEKHCPTKAITGKLKERFFIDQEKCIKCGVCFENCAFKAIEKR
ncbi:MAG: NADH-quinone oxidoreductase subunit NuoF [Nanoarchaeota archaeon]|nr:NADH-quinone oxidoreductase subunit NuoF [Nanoarchaeota archaeon]MBU1704984.1 NADH-quinone oxidoreductase subunit NuoF [Nanoarchaeota archaeon]